MTALALMSLTWYNPDNKIQNMTYLSMVGTYKFNFNVCLFIPYRSIELIKTYVFFITS